MKIKKGRLNIRLPFFIFSDAISFDYFQAHQMEALQF
jgi:hypothetical protein